MQDQELTGWFELSEQKPWEPGVYEAEFLDDESGFRWFSHWDGENFNSGWMTVERCIANSGNFFRDAKPPIRWRGLSSDPNAKPKPKRPGNPKVTRYVVIDVMKGDPVASFHTRDAAVDYAERMAWPRIKRVRHRSPE